jgi:hypothetical protein
VAHLVAQHQIVRPSEVLAPAQRLENDHGLIWDRHAPYVAEHLEHAYALTAHTIQGGTVDWAGVVGHPDDFTRNWSYTALSRARDATEIFVIDTPTEHQLDRDEIAPGHPKELGDERTPVERLEAAMRRRDDEDLALDRIDRLPSATRGDINLPSTRASADGNDPAPQSVDELRTDLAQLDALADQVRASSEARREAQRIVDEASARITELERRPRGILRCGTSDPARPAFERERLKAAEHQIVETAERERELAGSLSARGTPQLEHEAPRKGAAAIETELAILRQRGRHGALESSIEPYLTVALGPLPEQPRARRTWEQAAHRIEADRFEHGISDPTALWDPHPPASPCEHTGSEHSETSTELDERSARRSPASTTSFRHSVATAAATREQARGISVAALSLCRW